MKVYLNFFFFFVILKNCNGQLGLADKKNLNFSNNLIMFDLGEQSNKSKSKFFFSRFWPLRPYR